jgi:hypothetical protein
MFRAEELFELEAPEPEVALLVPDEVVLAEAGVPTQRENAADAAGGDGWGNDAALSVRADARRRDDEEEEDEAFSEFDDGEEEAPDENEEDDFYEDDFDDDEDGDDLEELGDEEEEEP